MKHQTLLLPILSLLILSACGGKKTQTESADATANDSTVMNTISELVFLPNLDDFQPFDLSDGTDDNKKYIPAWNDEDQIQENDGVLSYNLSLGYELPLQQLFQDLPGKPNDMNEVSRVIIFDLNRDGYSDALICLGSYGNDNTMYFDAYTWNEDRFGGTYDFVENFRNIPNPRFDETSSCIAGRNGNDREIWVWKGINTIEKSNVTKDYYK